jgi:hypothetical protein
MFVRICFCLFLVVGLLPAQGGRGGRGAPGPGQPQAPPPATDCAASGTVVNGMTGEPIPKAMVSMGGADGAGSATDALGRWSMTNVTCGNRFVTATRPGFISGNNGQAGPATRPRIQLVSGTPVTSVKVALMPEASVTGRVLDVDGDPVEQVQIRLMRVVVENGTRVLNQMGGATVDAQGNFRVGGLQPGRYIVCASSRMVTYPVGGGAGMVYGESCFPGGSASGMTSAMPIEAGREVRTSFTLVPVRGAHVRGSVSGVPITSSSEQSNGPRAVVQLMQVPNGFGGHTAQVKPDGTFDIAAVPPGSYIARVNLPGNQANGPAPTAMATVEVGDGDINGVALTIQSAGSLSGSVHFEFSNPATAANPVVDVNLIPPASGINFVGPIPRVHWDADHLNFDFANVPPAPLRFNAYVNSAGVYIKSATLRGQDVLNDPVTVNGATGPIDVVVSDDTGSINVTANDKDDHPVAASVILVPATGAPRFLNSGDDGQASQKNFPVGEYRVWAFADITKVPYAEAEWMAQNAGSGERVTITSGGTANITVKRIVTAPE